MRRLILFLIILVASVWIGLKVINHPGYLLMVYQPWMIQMPLWFAILSLLVAFILFYLIITSVDRLQFWWFRVKSWLRRRRERQSYSKTQYGLMLLIEGRFKKAERLLLAGFNQSVEPLINYLGAAKAAHEQGAFDRRDRYIQKAHQIAPDASLAIGLVQAELELSQDHLEQAEATLNRLRHESPRHPQVLKLLEKVYVRLADWRNLLALLPAMRKAKLINAEQAALFEKNVYSAMLDASTYKTRDEIQAMWNEIPKSARKNPDVVLAYVKQLQRFSDTSNEIQELIRKTIKTNWQPELINIYSTLPFDNLNRQLVVAGAWLKIYGPKPELLLLLGKLCVRVQLWGKAKDYFDKCLALGPNADASLEYGKLLEHLGAKEDALEKYKQGLASCSPMPSERALIPQYPEALERA